MGSGVFVLVLIACFQSSLGVLLPKCLWGKGVRPGANPYGEEKPGDCVKCSTPNCLFCQYNYKMCSECKPGTGYNSKKTACLACAGKSCGYCDKNYKTCKAKVADCAKELGALRSVASSPEKYRWRGDYCTNEPSLIGTGYSSVYTPLVRNGTCVDCNGPNFRPLTDGKMKFCSFYDAGRKVAANAFKKKRGCPYPKSIEFTLQRACVSQKSNFPFDIELVYEVRYCGEKKVVVAMGGGAYEPRPAINPVADWAYAVKA